MGHWRGGPPAEWAAVGMGRRRDGHRLWRANGMGRGRNGPRSEWAAGGMGHGRERAGYSPVRSQIS